MTTSQEYWNQIYTDKLSNEVSWFQNEPLTSLNLITSISNSHSSVIDIGAGASMLIDELVSIGYEDLTILDAAPAALLQVQSRLGSSADTIEFIPADITSWTPRRHYDVWHDRAVFHFMTTEKSRSNYLSSMDRAVGIDGHVVLATFSEDGPETCSGLPVRRYTIEELVSVVGSGFQLISSQREVHTTPWGAPQPFNWVVLRRNARS